MISLLDWRKEQEKDHNFKPPTLTDAWLPEQLPKLAALPLVWAKGLINPSETLKKYKSMDAEIILLITLLYNVPRSTLVQKIGQNPTLGTLTPLPMYAHKLYNDIPYNKWDRASEHTKFFLGRGLEKVLEFNRPVSLNIKEILELRKAALSYRTGAKAGTMSKLTSYKCNQVVLNNKKWTTSQERNIIRMIMQTWIANIELRNEDSMILDPYDWSNIPEAVDAVVQKEPQSKIETYNDWDII